MFPCVWCKQKKCKLDHYDEQQAYRLRLHLTALRKLKQAELLMQEKGESWYEDVVRKNARLQHKSVAKALRDMKMRQQRYGEFGYFEARKTGSKISRWLRKREKIQEHTTTFEGKKPNFNPLDLLK